MIPSHQTVAFTGHAGITLAGDAWGDPGAAPVVLLPGGGQTRHSWRGTGRAIARAGWFAISLDARGHGDSGWPTTATTRSMPSPPTCAPSPRPAAARPWWSAPRSAASPP